MGLFPHVTTSSISEADQKIVFVSALLGLAVSVAFVSHTVVRAGLDGQLWNALSSRITWPDAAVREQVMKKLDAESQHNACSLNFIIIAWCCVNLSIMVVNTASRASRWMTVSQDVVWIFCSVFGVLCQLALRRRQGPLTVTAVYVAFMLGQTVFVSAGPGEQVPYMAMASLCMLTRGLWSLACARVPVVVFLTVLHFFAVCAGFARTGAACADGGGRQQNLQIFVLSEFVGDLGIVLCTVVWRHFCRLRILHEIQASISQDESAASRSLLNIVCDATVELDEHLHIKDDTPRLASLLQHGCDRSLRGASMVQFVVEDDRQIFTDRIRSASDECMANVFHTRFRDGISNVVSIEVFHVRVSALHRADSHLIGVREHADAAERVATLPPSRLQRKGRARDLWRAPPAGGEPDAPPRAPASSSSSPSSERSFSVGDDGGDDGQIVVWIEVLSERWAIHSFSSGFGMFWGCGRRTARASRGARELLEWVKPDHREPLIAWVQTWYQTELARRRSGGAQSPASSSPACSRYPHGPVHFRSPALQHVKAKLTYATTIDVGVPEEQLQSPLARLTFVDIRVMHLSAWTT